MEPNLTNYFSIDSVIIFSQWHLLGMTLFGFLIGYLSHWYPTRKLSTKVKGEKA